MGRKKKEIKIKEPVRIREKRLNDGNVSLYLDMYYRGARYSSSNKINVFLNIKYQSCNTLIQYYKQDSNKLIV